MTTIKIEIGSRREEFVLVETNAPRAYDHGAALEVYDASHDGKTSRYLLLPAHDLAWQQGRNASGLHTCVTDGLLLDERDLSRFLWQRLYGEEPS